MTQEEAINLLKNCMPLVNKVTVLGIGMDLDERDKAQLNDFKEVLKTHWLDDPTTYQKVGVEPTFFGKLEYLAPATD